MSGLEIGRIAVVQLREDLLQAEMAEVIRTVVSRVDLEPIGPDPRTCGHAPHHPGPSPPYPGPSPSPSPKPAGRRRCPASCVPSVRKIRPSSASQRSDAR